MIFEIRPLVSEDLDAWIDLSNRVQPFPRTVAGFEFAETFRPAGEPALRLGAWTEEGELAGLAEGELSDVGYRYVDRAGGFVAVDHAYRRQGLGGKLELAVEAYARAASVRWLDTRVQGQDLAVVEPWLTRYGFVESERGRLSTQRLADVDLSQLDMLRERLARQGIETVAFPDVDSESSRKELYRCAMEIERDMPAPPQVDWTDASLEDFVRRWLHRPGWSPDGLFVARDGGHIVGLTYVVRRASGEGEVEDTGVLRTHRRRGIARVLKLMATRYAKEQGMVCLHTENSVVNDGMLAINRELGFIPGDVIVTFEKVLR